MPPRFAYWTILAGGLPTAFRAAERDDLLPTFRRIQEKHPDAEMKWFARGKLWASPEDARAARDRPVEQRNRSWRPGGDHRDRRESFKTAARERNQARRQERFARKQRATVPHDTRGDDNRRAETHRDASSARRGASRKTGPQQRPGKRQR
jgi:hypothetical protein